LPLVADMNFEAWQKKENQAFVNYQTQMDKEFVLMLKKEWKAYLAIDTPVPYKRPKPPQQPTIKIKPRPQKLIEVTPQPFIRPQPIPPASSKKYIEGTKSVDFDFFGLNVSLNYDDKLKFKREIFSTDTIANFWNQSSSSNYRPLIKQFKEYQDRYELDGWITYLLVTKFTQQITLNHNSQRLLSWFIMLKLGMDVKIGFATHDVTLLISEKEMIYGFSFFRVSGKKYYQFNKDANSKLHIYQDSNNALKTTLFLKKESKLPLDIKHRELRFQYHNKMYIFDIHYNKNLVDLYATHPQREHNQYGDISSLSRQFITQNLAPIVSNMNQIDAINFLLRLTQNGFKYKTDQENFGKEKVMYFEETLHYAYSDCEDRAIFFAVLVKELLALNIVLIRYPNHLATAIKLNLEIGGDNVVYNNQKYYIADPTYNNANIGQAMPQLKGQEIKILTIK